MKTEGLKQALNKYGFDAAFGVRAATKRNPALKSESTLSVTLPSLGSEKSAPGAVAQLQRQINKGESIRVFPLSNWTEQESGNTSGWKILTLFHCISLRTTGSGTRRYVDDD